MNQEVLQRNILDQCDQIVIYGANGWMGRSALDFIIFSNPNIKKEKILLIGSKHGSIELNNSKFEVFDPVNGFTSIRKNAIFFNAAFLRREFLQKMTPLEYVNKNKEIVELAKRTIKNKKLFSFINLSSGAAGSLDQDSKPMMIDEYARLKKTLEIEYFQDCNENKTSIVNCRIFNLSGNHLNEFENLALSSFINQAQKNNRIEVKSPATKRTFIDATSLAGTLLSVAIHGESANIDSGGELVTMLELAQNVATVVDAGNCQILTGGDEAADYFGKYEEFNSLAVNFGHSLLGIQEQIQKTLAAFSQE